MSVWHTACSAQFDSIMFFSLSSSPSSYATIISFCSLANLINSADRVIMPITIVSMSLEYGWNIHQKGWILSAFSVGFFTSQLMGAGAAPKYGAKFVLAIAVFLWSLSTFMTPWVAHNIPFLITIRILMGLGEGFGLPAIFHVYSETLLPAERSRAFGYLLAFGSIGQCAAMLIIPHVPWTFSFRALGVSGFIWTILWLVYYKERRTLSLYNNGSGFDDQQSQQLLLASHGINVEEKGTLSLLPNKSNVFPNQRDFEVDDSTSLKPATLSSSTMASEPSNLLMCFRRLVLPFGLRESKVWSARIEPCLQAWLPYFMSGPLYAIYAAHFAMNWSNYIVAHWLPTYLSTRLGARADHLSLTAIPYAVNSVAGVGVAHWAELLLVRQGRSLLYVRRLMTCIGLCIPALLFVAISATHNVLVAIAFISLAMAAIACNSCGHLSNHSDIVPRHAGTTFAIANTIGALPGVICGPLTADLVHKTQGRWSAVFWIAGLVNILGALFYCSHSSTTQLIL